MAAMLDQSLDAMIKETRKTTPKRRGAATKKKQIGGKKKTPMKKNGGGPAPMAVGGVKKANKKKKPARSKGAMSMAVDVAMGGQRQKKKNGSTGPTQGGRTKLVVGNLDFKVNDRDIKVRLDGNDDDFEYARRHRAPRGVDAFVVEA